MKPVTKWLIVLFLPCMPNALWANSGTVHATFPACPLFIVTKSNGYSIIEFDSGYRPVAGDSITGDLTLGDPRAVFYSKNATGKVRVKDDVLLLSDALEIIAEDC